LQAMRDKLAVLERVPGASNDRTVQEQRATALTWIGVLCRMLGDSASSAEARIAALREATALIALEPGNMKWRDLVGWAQLALAESRLDEGDAEHAEALLGEASASLAGSRPGGPKVEIVNHLLLKGTALALQMRQAKIADSSSVIAQAQSWLTEMGSSAANNLAAGDEKAEVQARLMLALANLLARSQRPDEARRAWSSLSDWLRPAAEQAAPPLQLSLAVAEWRLGHRDAARAIARRLQQTPFKPPEFIELVRAIEHDRGP
jgi:hypothetical protein